METIHISSRLYDYTVDIIDNFREKLQSFGPAAAYVADKRVYDLYRDAFQSVEPEKIYFVEAAEHQKNMETVLDLISFWQRLGVRKEWKAVCIGGGITQDVTTIASNLFLRNIEWYFFPTTLLSMCDSCIGGKCGINLGAYKNQIGVFYPPRKIFIDAGFLKTLSEDDYINGWGELLKFSLTDDEAFYQEVKAETDYIPCKRIAGYIHKGLMVKKRIIEKDEFESDLRRVLNYGHTFGHALESYTKNEIPHGKGVIWGIDVVNYIAWREGLISREIYEDVHDLIWRAFLKERIEVQDPRALFEIIRTDKKVRGDVLNFAMPDSVGHLIVYPMKIDQTLEDMFLAYIEETNEHDNH